MEFDLGVTIHKRLFPKATVSGQLMHLAEEVDEYEKAETISEKYDEIGDIIVCIISLFRFDETYSLAMALMRYYYYNHDPVEREKRLKYYKKAIEKCKRRVSEKRYTLVNGNYKRVKVDINV